MPLTALWEKHYKNRRPSSPLLANYISEIQNNDDLWGELDASFDIGDETPDLDELHLYWNFDTEKCDDPLIWWNNHQKMYPNLTQMAYDLLAIPQMSDECERIFSSAKHLISDTRNRLHIDIIDACECLNSWLGKTSEGVEVLSKEVENEI